MQSGSLTTREAGRLEGGEARISKKEARAGADGNVNAHEQAPRAEAPRTAKAAASIARSTTRRRSNASMAA